jgi:hypothetical protein
MIMIQSIRIFKTYLGLYKLYKEIDMGFMLQGEDQMGARLLTMRAGLQLELKGLRMSRGVSCYALVKQETGLKGSKQKVYDQFEVMLKQAGILQEIEDEE